MHSEELSLFPSRPLLVQGMRGPTHGEKVATCCTSEPINPGILASTSSKLSRSAIHACMQMQHRIPLHLGVKILGAEYCMKLPGPHNGTSARDMAYADP